MRLALRSALLAVIALPARAQTPSPAGITGVVVDAKTKLPIPSANVFILGTLTGAISDSIGRFNLPLRPRSADTLIVKRLGYHDARLATTELRDPLSISLSPEGTQLEGVVARASRYVASDEPGAVLTPLEIVTIPGTAADVNRAIQTLPGVQQVDDGTGLYVRGGDYTETRVYLNDGRLLNPAQLQSSAGTFVGTLDPFLLDAVSFSSGGFGARYGDALSGIVELHTQRRPAAYTATLSAGLGAVGINAGAPGPYGTGMRVVVDENNLSPVLRLNGSPRAFSVGAEWRRSHGERVLELSADGGRVGIRHRSAQSRRHAHDLAECRRYVRDRDARSRAGRVVVRCVRARRAAGGALVERERSR